jgi:hypothetical protein
MINAPRLRVEEEMVPDTEDEFTDEDALKPEDYQERQEDRKRERFDDRKERITK